MKKRIIGVVAAVLLALVGTAALVAYVQSAKDRAIAPEAETGVLVVSKRIPAGASADEIKASVRVEMVPTRLKQPGAITKLDDIGKSVAKIELLEGEQLSENRLGSANQADLALPKNRLAISVAVEPERAVGGAIEVGDTVGVFLSFEPFDLGSSADSATASTTTGQQPKKSPNMTHLQFHKVLVTGVQLVGNSSDAVISRNNAANDEGAFPTAPQQKLVVTLALTPPEAEQLVFAAEFGRIWLANQPATVSEDGTRIVTLGDVYAVTTR